jgi:hypothetical protein
VIDLDDYKLERSGQGPVTLPPPRSPNSLVWTAAIVGSIAIAGGLWWYISSSQRQPVSPPAVSVPPAAQPTAAPERPEAPLVKAADIDLPPLAQSDPIVRELVTQLSSHPTIAAWLATKGLIANFTLVTLTIAEGRTPARFLRPIAPRGPFRTTRSREDLFVDPRSYERYTPHGDAIAALDPVGTASLYLTLKPRITDAYRELGYPEGDFDRVLERAIGVLLQTPVLDEKVPLDPNGVTYAYSDPKLESLSPVQKQLLRLGPRNGQVVRDKLEEIAALLKLQPEGRRR